MAHTFAAVVCRSHRSNQVSAPIYKFLISRLAGERRFAAAVARRLESLGALTRGDRRAASGADLSQFNFESKYGKDAIVKLARAIINRSQEPLPGVDLRAVTDGTTMTGLPAQLVHDRLASTLATIDMTGRVSQQSV